MDKAAELKAEYKKALEMETDNADAQVGDEKTHFCSFFNFECYDYCSSALGLNFDFDFVFVCLVIQDEIEGGSEKEASDKEV